MPKRATSAAPSQAKKARQADGVADGIAPRDPRWAAVSGSANIAVAYNRLVQNPVKAHSYVLLCEPPFENGDEDEENDEEENEAEDTGEGNETKEKKTECDGGITCLCGKPVSEKPDHPWKLTSAAQRKIHFQHILCELRNPDNFDMYTFNDHAGYGTLEVVQNLLLDFEQAAGNLKEQWVICETLAYWLPTSAAGELTTIDDGDTVNDTFILIGRLFVSTLARLEREGLLAPHSEIQSLGTVMGLFVMLSSQLGDYSVATESRKEPLGTKAEGKHWHPHRFDRVVLAYALKHGIELVGPHNMAELISERIAEGDAPLPGQQVPTTAKVDPFGFEKALKAYKIKRGGICGFLSKRAKAGTTRIGGDALDLTTWTSAERKRFAYDGKDPIGKKEQDAIKAGDILSMG